MPFELKDKKVLGSGKRHDLQVEVSPWFKRSYELKLRIMSYEPITSDEGLEELVEQVISRRNEWRACKNSCLINLKGATAYILHDSSNPQPDPDSHGQPDA